jgi:hypothetical protein
LRKRHRGEREVALKEEEEAKNPKNFALKMVIDEEGDTDQLRRAKQAQSMQSYRRQKMEARDQIR